MRTALIRSKLLRRRRELLLRYHGELDRADEELAEVQSEDVERSAEQWDALILSRLGDVDADALSQVVLALRRIDAGTYGACATCGEPIAKQRLDAIPTASTCIGCAHGTEARATVHP